MVPLPKALLRSVRNFLRLHVVLTVKYSERRIPEVKDAVNACSSSTQ